MQRRWPAREETTAAGHPRTITASMEEGEKRFWPGRAVLTEQGEGEVAMGRVEWKVKATHARMYNGLGRVSAQLS
jgi:hypothetical protein